jgi:uncharacterized protein YkwD
MGDQDPPLEWVQSGSRRADQFLVRVRGHLGGALALLVVVAVLAPVAGARTGQAARANVKLQSGILQELNALRMSHHLHTITLSPSLTTAAAAHTKDMAAHGYFAHESQNGAEFWKRVKQYYGSTGYGYWSVGENLLWSSPDVDPARAIKLWLASPEHRKNMLNPRWREIGISAVHVSAAPGVYGDHEVTIVTTDFGVRR